MITVRKQNKEWILHRAKHPPSEQNQKQNKQKILTPTISVDSAVPNTFAKVPIVVLAIVALTDEQKRLTVLGDVVKVNSRSGSVVADGNRAILELSLAARNVGLSRKIQTTQAGSAVIVGIAVALTIA